MPYRTRHSMPDAVDLRILCQLYNVPEIARRLGVSNATVRRWLRRCGLSAKRRVRAPKRSSAALDLEHKRAINKLVRRGLSQRVIARKLKLRLGRVQRLMREQKDPVGYLHISEVLFDHPGHGSAQTWRSRGRALWQQHLAHPETRALAVKYKGWWWFDKKWLWAWIKSRPKA